MKIEDLKKIIINGESQNLEFKNSTAQLKNSFETICAFLNDKGGTILFGVKDNGELVGQNVTDNTKREIAREIKKIEPKAQLDIQYISISDEKQVIFIRVLSGKHIPYVYDSRPFERSQSTTERMTQHRYEQLIVERGQQNHAWDDQYAHNYDISHLDHDEIRDTIKNGVDQNRIPVEVLQYDIERILNKLELINSGKLTHAAVVLFAKEITNQYSQCSIKLARFRGRDKLEGFIDNQWLSGNAFYIVKAAHDFASRHLPIAGYFESGKLQRIDAPALPALALREALINSICHRDYMGYSSSITLAIYDDRLELWNAGELPPQLKLEDLRKSHSSVLRNKHIANVFYKRGWIESWGTGTLRMLGFCQKNKMPEPEFDQFSGGFSIIFRFSEAMNTALTQEKEAVSHFLNPRQKEIIDILQRVKEIPATQIRELMQDKPSIRTLQYQLNKLKQMGVVSSKGHAHSFAWSLIEK